MDEATADDTAAEEWRAIPGYDGYEASSLGRIRRRIASNTGPVGFMMKTSLDRNGYLKICIWCKNVPRHTHVHRVIAEAFHGKPPTARHQVAHWDGDRTNNRANNLRWATAAENAKDRDRHGRTAGGFVSGSRHPGARLTESTAADIKRRRMAGESGAALAVEYGLSQSTVCDINRGRTWAILLSDTCPSKV